MLGLALKASFSTYSTVVLNLNVLLSSFLALFPGCSFSWQHSIVGVTAQRSPGDLWRSDRTENKIVQ